MEAVPGVTVGPWQPHILFAADTLAPDAAQALEAKLRAGYAASPVRYDPPEGVFIGGNRLAVIAERRGLLAQSIHMNSRFRWPSVFEGVGAITTVGGPALVALNSEARSYYHWTLQALAALLVQRRLGGEAMHALVPDLDGWRRAGLDLLGLADRLIELAPGHGVAVERAVTTNLTGGDYAFAPHPAVLQLYVRNLPRPAHRTRRLYLSRGDMGGRRRMTNEAELCRLLERHGFDIVTPAEIGLAQQVALVREAALIVAPHGGALANLSYVDAGEGGPHVIELLQADYPNRCFAKIGQAKRLRYSLVVNPCVDRAASPHLSSWAADLPLVEAALAAH